MLSQLEIFHNDNKNTKDENKDTMFEFSVFRTNFLIQSTLDLAQIIQPREQFSNSEPWDLSLGMQP